MEATASARFSRVNIPTIQEKRESQVFRVTKRAGHATHRGAIRALTKPRVKINVMFRRLSSRFAAVFAILGLSLGVLSVRAQDTDKRGRKFKAPPATARLEVTILRDFNGKPIENAAVVFHPMEGEKDKGNMELKTNEDGKTVIDVLPIGDTVRLQVIAKGFQTYGEDYKIDKAEMAIEIKMKRPGEQYSIYKPHPADNDPNKGQGKETSPNGSQPDKDSQQDKNKDSDAPKDKPADSSQPSQPQTQPQ